MAQQVQAFAATNPEHLGLINRTHMVQNENTLWKATL